VIVVTFVIKAWPISSAIRSCGRFSSSEIEYNATEFRCVLQVDSGPPTLIPEDRREDDLRGVPPDAERGTVTVR